VAIGTKSDFKIYNEEFWTGATETLEQQTNVFNEASKGSVRLMTVRRKGDYEKESFFKNISSLVTRRDVTATTSATAVKAEQDEIIGVKLNRKIGPVDQTIDSMRKIASNEREFSFLIGQQVGKAMAVDMADSAFRAIAAALSNITTLSHTVGGTLTHSALVTGMSKRGDAGSDVVAWVMHSKPYYDLVKQAIADKVTEVAGVTIINGTVATFNRPTIVSDSPALISGSNYIVLGLVPDAVVVEESEDRQLVDEVVTGLENLVFRLQGEYAFNLKVRGFRWDITNGGANPTDAAVGTAGNWDVAATVTAGSITGYKRLGGVRIVAT
jgi:hypothetical protein